MADRNEVSIRNRTAEGFAATGVCRSCGASIFWICSATSGKAMPVDRAPSPTGTLAYSRTAECVSVMRGDTADAYRADGNPTYTSHFATCPNAAEHRRKRDTSSDRGDADWLILLAAMIVLVVGLAVSFAAQPEAKPAPQPTPAASVLPSPRPSPSHAARSRPVVLHPTEHDFYRLRVCESTNNYRANTGNGYFGAYQFDLPTWHSNGGHGHPDLASPEIQDRIARLTQSRRGWQPWPTCPRRLGLR